MSFAGAAGSTSFDTSGSRCSVAPTVTVTVRPERNAAPETVSCASTSRCASTTGCPLLATQVRDRWPRSSGTRHTADWAPRARSPAPRAAPATSPGVVAAARAELRCWRCWARSRLANSVTVKRARSTAWAAAPVMVNRKLRSALEMVRGLQPVDDHHPHGPVGDHQGHHGQRAEPGRAHGRLDDRPLTCEVGDGLGDEGHPSSHDVADGPVGVEGHQQVVAVPHGVVAELPVRLEHPAFVGGGEDGGVDVQLVAQGGEDGVGHLSRVGRRRQGPSHRLHALGRLGRHPPPPLVARGSAG